MWFEQLPEQCPPADAVKPNGVYYRLTETSVPICSDFWSNRKLWAHQKFNTCECIAMSVSVFQNVEPLKRVLKMPAHKNKTMVEVTLIPEAGLIMKTFGVSHFSWWRSADFPILNSVVAI